MSLCSVLLLYMCFVSTALSTQNGGMFQDRVPLNLAGTPFSDSVASDLTGTYRSLYSTVVEYGSLEESDSLRLLSNYTINATLTETFQNDSDVLNIPVFASPFVPLYNLQLTTQLVLSRQTLVDIYLQKIMYWDDSAIQNLNPSLDLPHDRIAVVFPTAPSGMTRAMSQAFCAISDEWTQRYGIFDEFPLSFQQTPGHFGIPDTFSMLTFIRLFPASLGFVDYANVVEQQLDTEFAYMENAYGKVVPPAEENLLESLDDVELLTSDLVGRVELSLSDSQEPKAWPFVQVTYLQFHKNNYNVNNTTTEKHCDNLATALSMANWILRSYMSEFILLKHGSIGIQSYMTKEVFTEFVGNLTCDGHPVSLFDEPFVHGKGEDYVRSSVVSPYSQVSNSPMVQQWSPWFNDLGTTIDTSKASSYDFSPLASSHLVDGKGYLISTTQLSSGISFASIQLGLNSSSGISIHQHSSLHCLIWACTVVLCCFRFRFNFFVLVLFVLVAVSFWTLPVQGQFLRYIETAAILPVTGNQTIEGSQQAAIVALGISDINNKTDIDLGDYTLTYKILDSESTETGSMKTLRNIKQALVVFTSHMSEDVRMIAPSIQDKGLMNVCLASSEALTSLNLPYLVRTVPTDSNQGIALADLVMQFNWAKTVGTLSTSDVYGSTILKMFSGRLSNFDYSPLASQQFVSGSLDLLHIVRIVRDSRARVIANFMSAVDMQEVLRTAERLGMLHSSRYVWLCSDACASTDLFASVSQVEGKTEYSIDWKQRKRAEGMVGLRLRGGHGDKYEEFLTRWESLDPEIYPGARQPQLASFYAPYLYDSLYIVAYSFMQFINASEPDYSTLISAMNTTSFTGLTGQVVMDVNGKNRMPEYQIINLPHLTKDQISSNHSEISQGDFVHVGVWNILNGPEKKKIRWELENNYWTGGIEGRISFSRAIQWGDGTTELPNLDIRNPIKYWSCSDREMRTDETGRNLQLDKPDGGNGNIADYYRCDEYIDCYNLSDEWGCTVSFPVAFIVYGIIIALLLMFAILCLIFTCVFGFCFRRRRVRAASPVFLILMIVACIVGYLGLFSFFGQPEAVACGFRIWIVALSIVIMICSLFAKSFRIWRLYRSPTEIKAMQDWKLFMFVMILVLPVVILLVLWTILSTPGAELREQDDKHQHYVCVAEGVAHDAGSYTFFAVIVAYIGLILLFGTFLSAVTRNVVSTFNESRLIAISIYNLVFLGVVIIPIYFVLRSNGPVVSWVIIVTAVLYALSATLFLQFIPKMWGVIFTDRLEDVSSLSNSTPGSKQTETPCSDIDSKAIW